MLIEKITLKNFRNFAFAELAEISPRVNLLYGKNAQGKTNFIEAVNYLSCGKSFRGADTKRLIKEGEDEARLGVRFRRASHGGEIEAALFATGTRSISLAGVPIRKVGELLGVINTVVFAPEDLRAVKESPSLRRRLIDMELSKISPAYYGDILRYYKIVKTKNTLLKQPHIDERLLGVYNDAMADCGARIITRRAAYIEALAGRAADIHAELAGGGETLELRYRASADPAAAREALLARLEACAQREREMRISLAGPHREDMAISINGRDARMFASQGQQRSAMLSIKLAIAAMAADQMGEAPVVLLDDVFSELDNSRRERLLALVEKNQVFITATDPLPVKFKNSASFYEVSGGALFLQ